ncbi:MAG TPA: hypothetical protein PK147_07260, partial [Saprospiraceae bacterium]|nr:hypothetical protein [Lewinellaceae bacterium]HPK10649.1 hypothetical protein [Saprospiraceae bacterium]HPQ21633.1 hypothetical protein [Saprospiraceae bacterium]
MNFQFIAYLIYCGFMFPIIIWIGNFCFQKGKIYIAHYAKKDIPLVSQINHSLLVAYYCVTLGYVVLRMAFWQSINSPSEMVISLVDTIGVLLLMLGILHVINLISIKLFFTKYH